MSQIGLTFASLRVATLALGLALDPAGSATAQPLAQAAPDRVLVHCAVAQGNGFNWAATLGWLAAEAELAAARAAAWEAEAPGRRAAIDLACFTGSSSGAFAGATLDALLANPRIVSGAAGPGLLSAQEAATLANALLFIALSTDFRGEAAGFLLSRIGVAAGLLERGDDAERLRPWRGRTTARRTAAVAARWIEAAARYDPAWFDALIAAEGPLPIRERPARAAAPDPEADATLRRLSQRARRMVDDRVGATRPTPDPLLRPARLGFCVTAVVAPAVDAARLPIDGLDLVLACDAATRDRLAGNATLAGWLAAAPEAGRRLRLAAAPDWRTMLNLSLREPDLVTPLSGPLAAPPIGLAGPVLAFNGTGFVPEPGGARLVMGGFATARLQAWTAAALVAEALDRHAAAGADVEARLAIFGRTEPRADPAATFAQRTIAGRFAPAPDGAEPLAVWYRWEDEFCAVAAALAPRTEIAFLRMDWNLSPSPAALTRQSRLLAAKGFNLPRLQASDETRARGPAATFARFLHDPRDEPRFLPEPPPGGVGCVPGADGL